MGCTPVSTTKIQNNTCVLTPVVTEGPYYHQTGHLIRQNIAEHQDGLMLVRRLSILLSGALMLLTVARHWCHRRQHLPTFAQCAG